MEVLRTLRSKGSTFPIIMLTAHGNVALAVEAMKAGASEYLTKPFDLEELKLAIDKALKYSGLAAEVERLRERAGQGVRHRGHRRVGPRDARGARHHPEGRTDDGHGDDLRRVRHRQGAVARAVHNLSDRADKPFISVSAGALPETLLESELFGYEKGAFTGAVTPKPGRFEMANGGTLFLDEIGDISPVTQVKLLRVLQERKFERLGGTRTIEVDVRVVAATNQDLQQLIADGDFREDLFYRLNVVPVTMPTLRQRPGDIPLLVAHFLEKFNAGTKTHQPRGDGGARPLPAGRATSASSRTPSSASSSCRMATRSV